MLQIQTGSVPVQPFTTSEFGEFGQAIVRCFPIWWRSGHS